MSQKSFLREQKQGKVVFFNGKRGSKLSSNMVGWLVGWQIQFAHCGFRIGYNKVKERL